MTEFRLTYYIKRKVSFQARDIKHAGSMTKGVINTIHRGINDSEFLVLSIEAAEEKKSEEQNSDEEKPSADSV